jgi:hypothetical protein
MKCGHFQPELLPPPRAFYEKELGKLTRPSRGWVRGNCPFHESRSRASFSVNLDSGGFYCFGCEAKGGDILDFVKLRDRSISSELPKYLGRGAIRRCPQPRNRRLAEHGKNVNTNDPNRLRMKNWNVSSVSKHAIGYTRPENLYEEAIAKHNWELMSLLLPEVREAEEAYWRAARFGVRHER